MTEPAPPIFPAPARVWAELGLPPLPPLALRVRAAAEGGTPRIPTTIPRHTLSESPVAPSESPSSTPLANDEVPEPELDTEVSSRRNTVAPHSDCTSGVRDRAALTVLTGVHAGQVFQLSAAETTLGRGRDATLRIDDTGISRKHTRVVRATNGRFFAEDLGSTNGTFVGGRRVDRAEVVSGDRIQIGPNVVLRFGLLDSTEEELARALYEASTRDALTRVFNRKHWCERLTAEVAYAIRHDTRVSVLMFDLDHFKRINDTHGHLAGDLALRVVAAQVQKTIRIEDLLARYGGEEFVIIVRGIEHEKVAVLAERVRRAVERLEMPWERETIRATVSVGVASLFECGSTGTEKALLAIADARLYRAKEGGRNRVCSK